MGRMAFEEIQKLIRLDKYQEIAEEYETIINEGIAQRWKKFSAPFENTNLDPVDERDDVVEMLKMFKYRMRLMIVCCLCETWEQDLYNFLKETDIIGTISNDFQNIKLKYSEKLSINIDDYKKIIEMRLLVNSIKHGSGNSYTKLKNKIGDNILADSNLKELQNDGSAVFIKQDQFDDNVLTSKTLNVEGRITEYYEEIMRFWKDVFSNV